MRKLKLLLSGILLLFSISCSNSDQLLKNSLAEAKQNFSELNKVILHYQKEDKNPLKEKAARFLIENMYDKYSYTGTLMNAYNEIFDTIQQNTHSLSYLAFCFLSLFVLKIKIMYLL